MPDSTLKDALDAAIARRDEAYATFMNMNIEELEGIREGMAYISQEVADKFFDDHIAPRFIKEGIFELELHQAVEESLAEDGWSA
jgi:hypothetical protein